MDDLLLMKILQKKGIISDTDIYEVSSALEPEAIYLSDENSHTHISDETKARNIVSKMYHVEGGKKYIGEKYSMAKAKEIYEKHKEHIDATPCEVYIAINTQYHDYITLMKSWFVGNIDSKIIESAMAFWFMDSDCTINKVHHYYGE